MYFHRPKKKKNEYEPNLDMIAEYEQVSKHYKIAEAKFDNYKCEQYKKIEATATFQTEERRRLQTDGPNSTLNMYEIIWDNSTVGDTLELIGKGKHPRKIHLGKKNRRNVTRDYSSTAKRRKNEGKTYMSKKSNKLMPGKGVNFIVF